MLKCPRCPRTELKPEALNQELSLAEFTQAFPQATLDTLEQIIFCGDIGDPIYAKDFLAICSYIKSQSKTKIKIVTNGSFKNTDYWKALAQILTKSDTVTFSIDGWDSQSNNLYRVNNDFISIIQGIQTLRANSACTLIWSMIYFSFNEDKVTHIRDLAQSLGFNGFQTVQSTKFDGRYLINGQDSLKPRLTSESGVYEKQMLWFTEPEPEPTIIPLRQHAWARCLNQEKELFINVQGLVFPCAWFNSGYQTNEFVQQHKDKLSIKLRSLSQVLADPVWSEFRNSLDSCTLEVCKIKCKHGQSQDIL